MKNVGIIGLGFRVTGILKTLVKYKDIVRIKAVADVKDFSAVQKDLTENGFEIDKEHYYADYRQMLENEQLDAVIIGTRCSLHTPIAVEVLKRDINLFIEKPVATNEADLRRLTEAALISKAQTVVSFPLRFSPLIRKAKELVEREEIGEIQHAMAYNYVPYGSVYFQSWYRDENETGGLFLQKATHDLDILLYLMGKKPVSICAMKSKQVFKGEYEANKNCNDCPKIKTCNQSPWVVTNIYDDYSQGDMCAFAVDTGNEDSGSCIIQFEDGIHCVYTQNFFIKKDSAKRGAILSGAEGSLEFDFYKEQIIVHKHFSNENYTYNFNFKDKYHWGGDEFLIRHFIEVLFGAKSLSSIFDGINSANVCLKAKESSNTYKYVYF